MNKKLKLLPKYLLLVSAFTAYFLLRYPWKPRISDQPTDWDTKSYSTVRVFGWIVKQKMLTSNIDVEAELFPVAKGEIMLHTPGKQKEKYFTICSTYAVLTRRRKNNSLILSFIKKIRELTASVF